MQYTNHSGEQATFKFTLYNGEPPPAAQGDRTMPGNLREKSSPWPPGNHSLPYIPLYTAFLTQRNLIISCSSKTSNMVSPKTIGREHIPGICQLSLKSMLGSGKLRLHIMAIQKDFTWLERKLLCLPRSMVKNSLLLKKEGAYFPCSECTVVGAKSRDKKDKDYVEFRKMNINW